METNFITIVSNEALGSFDDNYWKLLVFYKNSTYLSASCVYKNLIYFKQPSQIKTSHCASTCSQLNLSGIAENYLILYSKNGKQQLKVNLQSIL